MLGVTSESLEIGDLPVVTANMRATTLYHRMRVAMRRVKLKPLTLLPAFLFGTRRSWQWTPKSGSGWTLMYRLARVNIVPFTVQISLASIAALLFYAPAFFLQRLVQFLEVNKSGEAKDIRWGWVYCTGIFLANAFSHLSEYHSFVCGTNLTWIYCSRRPPCRPYSSRY
jgi:hypothetical protein